jgi:nitronate monooxygenase
MLQTRFCERFGVAAPIVVAPMGPDLTGPELVAAVCNAGGFGILQAQFCSPPLLRAQLTRLRALTDKPFGVNFILHFPNRDGIEVCIEERVAALSFFGVIQPSSSPPPTRRDLPSSIRLAPSRRPFARIALA